MSSTATEEVRIKRPRTTDIEDRDPKRVKNESDASKVAATSSTPTRAATTPTKGQLWVLEQLGKMEKLYKEVLIQAALIFQHQSFSERLGMKGKKVPTHMMHRLEASWRSYEGLRRQTEWCMAQSGQQPSKPVLTNKPTSTLEAIAKLAPVPSVPSPTNHKTMASENISPPRSIPLPIPSHLTVNGQIPAVSSPIPLGAASLLAFDGQRLQGPPGNEPIAISGGSDTTFQTQVSQQPPFQQTQIQSQPPLQQNDGQSSMTAQIPLDGSMDGSGGGIDYSSMGLEELTALINGEASAFGALDTTGQQQTQEQLQPQTIDLTLGGDPTANASGSQAVQNSPANNDAVLASFGLERLSQPPQDLESQIVSSDQHAQNNGATLDFDFSAALPTGSAEPDFSALAGLFSADDTQAPASAPQAAESTGQELGKIEESLETLMGGHAGVQVEDDTAATAIQPDNNLNDEVPAPPAQPIPEMSTEETMTNLISELSHAHPTSNNNGTVANDSNTIPGQPTEDLAGATSGEFDAGYGDMGGIDMSDFNFTDNVGMDGDEFDRLMAEFG
ncbi:hypothetical protein IAR55_004315 [Kwoniella newhampshirensis]|uniref:Uncharacterized protein n=1 Tax=Kwoniella newhampshirensis TaxID=1651941 RepID=A0AAW0YJE7_9TREE